MTASQKYRAIEAANGAPPTLTMDPDGRWCLNFHLEVKDRGILQGVGGRGDSPEEAIEDAWIKLTELPADQYVVRNAYGPQRRALLWNGFMWEDKKESAP